MIAPVRRSAPPVLLSVAVAASLASCRTTQRPAIEAILTPPPVAAPSVGSHWASTQTSVLALLVDNRIPSADSSLLQFSRDYAGTPEGDRARWWRALLRVDARAAGAAGAEPSTTIIEIDSLLADSISTDIRAEALWIRRSINALDSLRRLELRRRLQATQLATERLDELKSVRDSVSKLAAEIDRLKQRLRAP